MLLLVKVSLVGFFFIFCKCRQIQGAERSKAWSRGDKQVLMVTIKVCYSKAENLKRVNIIFRRINIYGFLSKHEKI